MSLLGLALLAACNSGSATLESDGQMASYAIGRDIGNSLKPASGSLDMAAFRRGMEDVMADRESPIADSLLQGALTRFASQVQEQMAAEQTALGEKNRTEGQAYLTENGAKQGVTTTSSGLQWEVMTAANGPKPTINDQVRIHYKGMLIDGTEFDSSLDGEPIVLGVSNFVPGFSEALQLMPVGSKYRFVIPSDLAYGPQGSQGVIPPNATLIFEVELLEIPAPPPAP
jgi:FKBP-type peptidyl-prolyl cis-trans isomerase FkpA/FKBP-type peptidyl-prolyl cis-trans isomerase FklB